MASEAGVRCGTDEEGYVVVIVEDKGGAADGHTSLDLRLDPPATRDLAFELLARAEEGRAHPSGEGQAVKSFVSWEEGHARGIEVVLSPILLGEDGIESYHRQRARNRAFNKAVQSLLDENPHMTTGDACAHAREAIRLLEEAGHALD